MQVVRLCLTVALVVLAGCGGGETESPDASIPSDSGTSGETDAGQTGDEDAGCTPKTCADTPGCGTYDDGCGGSLLCEASCACTETDWETSCPAKPCQTRAGCEQGVCQYVPVVCGGATCAPTECTGEGCELVCTTADCTDGLYSCGGGVCAGVTQYCDPSPTVVGGKVSYLNACVAPPSVGCGTCGLGQRSCETTSDRWSCANPPVPVVDEQGTLECDDTKVASTFLFLDTQYTGGGSDGSREKPFTTYPAALAAAQSRNSRGIVIAGAPVFVDPLVVGNGISVYGGFDASPDFTPNPSQRPHWNIGVGHLASNQLLGGRAENITLGTVLRGIDVTTASVTATDGLNGASSIALLVRDSTGLFSLVDVKLTAGDGANGVQGANGTPQTSLQDGTAGQGRQHGQAGSGCTTSCTVTPPSSAQGSNACGFGGLALYDSNSGTWTGLRGNHGNASGTVAGGAAGQSLFTNDCNSPDPLTPGVAGSPGSAGTPGGEGSSGVRGALTAQGVWTPNPGTTGTAGGRGGWGGGGGAGGMYRNAESCAGDVEHPGGPGGGGGGPGCGGDFGRPGGGGGASLGLALSNATQVQIVDSEITAGRAGNGGTGGTGRLGAGGGPGEMNPQVLCPKLTSGNPNYRGQCGGAGGPGGAGGKGGHGGGGGGGDAAAVFCSNSSAVVVEPSTTLAHGGAGAGGMAPAAPGAPGLAAQRVGCP